MENRISEADGNGKIDVNGQLSPVAYTLKIKEGTGRSLEINIHLLMSRDWLLQKGFNRDAVLVSESGARIPVYHPGGDLDVADNLSIALVARDDSCISKDDVVRKYPEFNGSSHKLDDF
jgi:hypothetical protein